MRSKKTFITTYKPKKMQEGQKKINLKYLTPAFTIAMTLMGS